MKKIRVKALKEKQILNIIVEIILKHLSSNVIEIFLFGSRSKKMNTAYSDYDIGVRGVRAIPFNIIQKIEDDLNELNTLKSFDIIDFLSVSDGFAEEALKNKRILYVEKDHTAAGKSL